MEGLIYRYAGVTLDPSMVMMQLEALPLQSLNLQFHPNLQMWIKHSAGNMTTTGTFFGEGVCSISY